MQTLRHVRVPRALALRTLDLVQEPGLSGLESLVLWLARFAGTDAVVSDVWQPRQSSSRSRDGLHLHVDGDELARLNEMLYRTGQTLLAQVHTHPLLPYHSDLDDARPVVTEEGAFSIVLPFFGFISLTDLSACAVYQIEDGGFVPLTPSEAASTFIFVG